MTRLHALTLLLGTGWLAGCGTSPPSPSPLPAPTPLPGPTLVCPSALVTESLDDGPTQVQFPVPVAQGGNAPVSVSCTPAPGSTFPVGETAVTCAATDALALTSSCTFNVTVRPAPRLSATRFLAFGDSITAGTASAAPTRHGLGEPHSYPFRLNDMLRARYRLQSFTVINSGRPAEVASAALSSITNLIGELRLSGELLTSQAEVLLLMEGTNDLFVCVGNCPGDGIPMVVAALDDMVRDGQQRGARVLLATIPPQRRGGRRDAVARVIPQLNDEIRALAARRNAVLVDVFAALEPGLQTLIGVDDLHPTIEGHRVIAETFFSAIQKAFEAPAAPAALRRVP